MAQVRVPLPEIRSSGNISQNPHHNSGQRPVQEPRGPGAHSLPPSIVCLLQALVDEQQTEGSLFTASELCARHFTAKVGLN